MSRVFVVGCGALIVCMLPYTVRALRFGAPGLEVRVGLTRSARQFVSPAALRHISGHPVLVDSWRAGEEVDATHVQLVEWADAFLVYPATAHLVARLSLGLCDTPFLTALGSTRVPIGVAPSLPPGMAESPAYRRHIEELSQRSNVVVAPTHVGHSAATGAQGDGAAGPWTEVVGLLRSRFFAGDPSWEPDPEAGAATGRSLASVALSWSERRR